jgi:NADH dehydrogenase
MSVAIPIIERPLSICVAGGTGFVGRELIVRLAAAGHQLRVPTRDPSRADELLPLSSVEIVAGDVYRQDFLTRAVDGCDVVINLVGILNESGLSGASFRRAHVEFTATLLRAMETAHVPRLLQMSALNADAERGRSLYLRTKGEGERLVRNAPAALDWSIFRPSVIFGARDSLTNRFVGLLRHTGGFLPLARAGARFAPVYVADVAEAFQRALHGGATSRQTYELGGPDILTLEQIVRISAEAAGLPCHILPLPDAVAMLQGAVMQWLPGTPFSLDNYRSLLTDSVCQSNGFEQLGIKVSSLRALAPVWLAPKAPAQAHPTA